MTDLTFPSETDSFVIRVLLVRRNLERFCSLHLKCSCGKEEFREEAMTRMGSTELSRRLLLQRASCVAGAMTVLGAGIRSATAAKTSQEARVLSGFAQRRAEMR